MQLISAPEYVTDKIQNTIKLILFRLIQFQFRYQVILKYVPTEAILDLYSGLLAFSSNVGKLFYHR